MFKHLKTFQEFISEDIISSGVLKSPEEIMEPFIEYFKTRPPVLHQIDSEIRFQYQSFKLAIHYRDDKTIFFVYIKTPEDRAGINFLEKNGFKDLIQTIEENSTKIGYNEKTKAKIYYFDND